MQLLRPRAALWPPPQPWPNPCLWPILVQLAAQRAFDTGSYEQARDLDALRLRADSRINAIIREVALFADRTDVSEEVTRLTSHLEQFAELIRKGEEAGRKLEFVIQEMGRETNTIGSKAGDVAISRHVFEIKATLEKLRELVLNVE